MSAQLEALGFAVLEPIDLVFGHDLLNDALASVLAKLINAGVIGNRRCSFGPAISELTFGKLRAGQQQHGGSSLARTGHSFVAL